MAKALALLFLLYLVVELVFGQNEWSSPFHDNSHSCTSGASVGANGNPMIVWTVNDEAFSLNSGYSPVAADGKFFLSANSSTMVALDEITGQKLWSYTSPNQISDNPVYFSGLLFFGENTNISAIDANTGSKVWSAAPGNATQPYLCFPSSVMIQPSTSTLYSLCYGSSVVVISCNISGIAAGGGEFPQMNRFHWASVVGPFSGFQTTQSQMGISPYDGSLRVFFLKNLFSINPVTGAQNWKFSNADQITGLAISELDGSTFLSDQSGHVTKISANGEPSWPRNGYSQNALSCICVDQSTGDVFTAGEDGVWSINGASGTSYWTHQLPSSPSTTASELSSCPALTSNRQLFVSGTTSTQAIASTTYFYSFDMDTGNVKTSFPTMFPQTFVNQGPVIGTQGTVFVPGVSFDGPPNPSSFAIRYTTLPPYAPTSLSVSLSSLTSLSLTWSDSSLSPIGATHYSIFVAIGGPNDAPSPLDQFAFVANSTTKGFNYDVPDQYAHSDHVTFRFTFAVSSTNQYGTSAWSSPSGFNLTGYPLPRNDPLPSFWDENPWVLPVIGVFGGVALLSVGFVVYQLLAKNCKNPVENTPLVRSV